jgi:hypothetical protein
MGASKVDCIFCGERRERALEHVFAKTWLEEFEAGRDVFHIQKRAMDSDDIEGERIHSFDSYRCGDVCEVCNNGWMSSLEATVKNWVSPMTQQSDLLSLQAPDRQVLFSRWAVKTACVIDHSGQLREVPKQIPHLLAVEQNKVPDNVHVFVGWQPLQERPTFGVHQRTAWTVYPLATPASEIPAHFEGSFKIAFSIGPLMVLVAGIPSDVFETVTCLYHIPIWPKTKVRLQAWYQPLSIDGLPPNAALRNFTTLLALALHGRMR